MARRPAGLPIPTQAYQYQHRLTNTNTGLPIPTSYPAWSPNGAQIAFDNSEDVYVMSADGSGLRQLTNSAGSGTDFVAWSPDGRKILFQRDGIYVMNADGSGVHNLTNDGAVNRFVPGANAWSPDGSKIAFKSDRDGGVDHSFQIYVMNADGSGVRRLTNIGVSQLQTCCATWSPDGARIAFVSTGDIYAINADGSALHNLTNNPRDYWFPKWSPDGTKILFYSNPPNGLLDLYVMNADGTGLVRLVTNPAPASSASWSPDGTQIVWDCWNICVMNADGTGAHNLTRSSPVVDRLPAWRPGAP